jgi:hypothetical protein
MSHPARQTIEIENERPEALPKSPFEQPRGFLFVIARNDCRLLREKFDLSRLERFPESLTRREQIRSHDLVMVE